MLLAGWLIAAALAAATLVRVYRGGTTWNDHAVAAVCVGCVGVYPVLWSGALGVGIAGPMLAVLGGLLGAGAFGIYVLFHLLDGRKDPGALVVFGYFSQFTYAWSLWAGLLLVFWIPLVGIARWLDATTLHPFWPGPALAVPLVLAGWGTAWTYLRHHTVNRHTLEAPGLGRPVRLVQLSDIHVSPVMTAAHMDSLVRRTNALSPDVVVVTGDLVMPFSEAPEEHRYLVEGLADIEAPVYCCPGNHDLPVTETLGAELEAVGVRWLVDESVRVGLSAGEGSAVVLEVAGLDFEWRDAAGQLAKALPRMTGAEDAGYRVLLAHDPRVFGAVPTDRFDLVLSGHTHGGQVGSDMFGLPGSVLRLFGLYDQGFFQRGPARLYVHRGNWHTGLPPRMGIAAEIAVFDLGTA